MVSCSCMTYQSGGVHQAAVRRVVMWLLDSCSCYLATGLGHVKGILDGSVQRALRPRFGSGQHGGRRGPALQHSSTNQAFASISGNRCHAVDDSVGSKMCRFNLLYCLALPCTAGCPSARVKHRIAPSLIRPHGCIRPTLQQPISIT